MTMRRFRILLWIALALYTSFHIVNVYSTKKKSLQEDIATISSKIIVEFAQGSNSITFLANNSSFKSYLATKNQTDKGIATDTFADLLANNPYYDQVRYLNAKGIETIRIDRTSDGPRIVPSAELQDKSSRYYFLDTMKLNEDEVFVSPLDLNIENGKIEFPEVPTLRMAIPVFYSEGERAGIIIINYDATELIKEIVQMGKNRPYLHLMLVNSDGYFIEGPTPDTNWGFMYSGREDEKFEKYFPRGWQKIRQTDNGIALSREGIYLFRKIYPIQSCQTETASVCRQLSYYSKRLSTRDFHFIIVAHANPSMLSEVIAKQMVLQPLLLGGAFLGVYYTLKRLHA